MTRPTPKVDPARVPVCEKCGQRHISRYGTIGCAGHLRALDDGTRPPCTTPPISGATVCRMHGGSASQVRAHAAERVAEQEAATALHRGLAAAYGANVPDIDPAEAMLRAVSWKYAEVVALRAKVAELEEEAMVWGRTREKSGGDDAGDTDEAKPNLWWTMLRQAEDQLVKFAAAARAAGVDERRVRLAEAQGQLVSTALRAILDALLGALLSAGMAPTLRAVWADAVATIVPRELRALTITQQEDRA